VVLGDLNAETESKEESGKREKHGAMVFRPRVKRFAEEIMVVIRVMEDKRKEKKQVQTNGMDLVDWFLAIDACRA
jgi:hypothetical protein